MALPPLVNEGVDFDFDEKRWVYKFTDLDHGMGGLNLREDFAMGVPYGLPLCDIGEENTRSYDVFESRTCLVECYTDASQRISCLLSSVGSADGLPVGAGCSGAGNENPLPGPHGFGVSDLRFPFGSGFDKVSLTTHGCVASILCPAS